MNSRARSICCSFRDVKWICPGSAQGVQASVSNSPRISPVAKQSPPLEPKEQPLPLIRCLSCSEFIINKALDLQVTWAAWKTWYELAWLQRTQYSSMGIVAASVNQEHLGDVGPTDNTSRDVSLFSTVSESTFFPLFPVNAWYNYYCPQIMNISPWF